MTQKRELIFDEISSDLNAMSKVVFSQMNHLKEFIENNKKIDFNTILHNELILDSFEVKIRQNVIKSIILYSPRTSDMRKIISCYDININLERIGDLIMNICKHFKNVDTKGDTYISLDKQIKEIILTTETMLSNAISSFIDENAENATKTIDMDDIVDNLQIEIREIIINKCANKNLSEPMLREIIALSDISYNIERIADNATNIIESAVYLIEGKNIQHTK